MTRTPCNAPPSQSLDGPESNCPRNHDHEEFALCDFCGDPISENAIVEFFPGEQWHRICTEAAKAMPGFLKGREVIAIGFAR